MPTAPRRTTAALATLGLAAALALTACGSSSQADDGTVRLVASTDVWGSVAEQVAGDVDGVEITSIIDNPSTDPHTYEASTRTQLALSRADVVVKNGGGYDDFVTSMLKGAGSDGTVLDAVDISGKKASGGGELNEHVWYDFPTVAKVAERIAGALGEADPKDKAAYEKNAAAFTAKLTALERTEAQIKTEHAGDGVAITEPVPLYLLQSAGLVNKTPAEFSEAIEEDTDVSPAVLKDTLDLFDDGAVRLLAYNEQTSGPQTESVLEAAKQNDVAVVPVTETLPRGKDYLSWMRGNLSAVESALGSAR